MKKIRFAVCGAGRRGMMLTRDILVSLPDVEVCAVTDPYADKAEELADTVREKTGLCPRFYEGYEELFDVEKPDAVLVATSWDAHIPVAISAMNRGIAVALEVGAVYNEKECRDLVGAYERTKTPFMLLENCCFGKDELLATAMARDGLFGEIVYCHGAYMHDLREQIAYGVRERHYRNSEYSSYCRDNYPTHDLGPIAKLIGINRGNRMLSLSSRASKARGINEYAKVKGDIPEMESRNFAQGDIIETIITCENGELINLRLDTTLPAYYSREFTVRGTKGLYKQDTNMAVFDGEEMDHGGNIEYMLKEVNNAVKYYDKYLPEMWKNITPEMIESGHGGMDIFEFEVFCDCLRNGKEMPIDVYDAAAWMSISYLTEQSIAAGGTSVEIPDFTNGAYKTRPMKDVIEL
ncbi:MAG: Gfo/Idh/MocA family oxidoreductase [Oscillospiraceae bacterium]|nr:Gfo/Idh/MocA family oxidoreductase [Oscillospiraceae bacterium]MBQ6698744.1 Gfo/Idh/MocA family oxidoreductase [Oscillospiraceae bacterium]MBQ9985709.1 Gfo/Idh/MocA family oxidoreductase [Oscillospiraceae bacterium]